MHTEDYKSDDQGGRTMSDDGDGNPYPPGSIAWLLWVHRHAVEMSGSWAEVATQVQIILANSEILRVLSRTAALGQDRPGEREELAAFPPMLQGWLDGIRHAEAFLKAVEQALAQAGHHG
jgi:hypothetical protein